VIDGADPAEQAEQSPEQGQAQDMGQVRLGMGQQVDAVGDKEAPASDDDVAYYDRGLAPAPPAQVDQRQADDQRDELGRVLTGDNAPGPEGGQQDAQDKADGGFDIHLIPFLMQIK